MKLATARRRKTKHQSKRSGRDCAWQGHPFTHQQPCQGPDYYTIYRDACPAHGRRAHMVTRNAIYTWSCIQLQHSLTRYLRLYSIDYSLSSGFRVIGILVSALVNPLTASGRIYPSKWHQGHGHQKESQHRYFWMDVHNQGIVGKVLFCSKRGCLYFWNRFRNDDVARLRSLNSARCPRSIAITAATALNSGAGCCRGNS